MSVFDYQAAIQITFDKEIITNPEIVTGTEYYENHMPPTTPRTPISSGDNGSYPKANAFDKSTSSHWQASSTSAPQWIGMDFGESVTLTKIGVDMQYSSGRINAYEIQGSDNGTDWYTIASGNFSNASGEQSVTFGAATYRYWRVYATSKYSSYYTVSEVGFYSTRNAYSTAGWAVIGSEYDKQPEGIGIDGAYTVRKVTKSPDNLSVILWLDMFDRMRDPAGQVTVTYDKLLGNLVGPYSAQVESFQLQFTPTNIVPYSNPNGVDHLSAYAAMTVAVNEVTYQYTKSPDDHISAQAGMTVVVTNVGGLPL